MTGFEFMANAFFVCVGVTCLSVAALIVCSVAIGIFKTAKRKKQEK